jgi:hypothetical protein
MSVCARASISYPRGDSNPRLFRFRTIDSTTNVASPVDLTGKAIKLFLKKKESDTTAQAVESINLTITNATAGEATLTLTPTQSNKKGIYYFDLVITEGVTITTIGSGEFIFTSGAVTSGEVYTINSINNLYEIDVIGGFITNIGGATIDDTTISSSSTWSSNKINSELSTKVDTIAGKGLSTEDYTTAEKSKLAGVQAGAEVNVNADWLSSSGDSQILNKPTISGSNTGDETTATIQSKRPLKTVAGQSLEGLGNVTLARGDVGLPNVDNTSDVNKPVSTATQTALNLKANDNAVVHLTGNETVTGPKRFNSNDTYFGAGNNDPDSVFVDIGNLGTNNSVYLDARSTNVANVDINYRAKGTGRHKFRETIEAQNKILFNTITQAGLELNRLTTAQRDALVSPTNGSVIYNTTTNKFNLYQNGVWVETAVSTDISALQTQIADKQSKVTVTVGKGARYDYNTLTYAGNEWNAVKDAHDFVASQGGGIVFVKKFSTPYLVGSSARLVPASNVQLKFDNYTVVEGSRASDWLILNPSSNGSQPIENFSVEGAVFDLQNGANASVAQLRDSKKCFFKNCKFQNGASGGWFANFGVVPATTSTLFGEDNYMENCEFDTHQGSLEMALIYNQKNFKFKNCKFKNKGTVTTGPVVGLWQNCENTQFTDCDWVDNNGFNYYSNSTNHTTITNCFSKNMKEFLKGSNVSDNIIFGPTGGIQRAVGLYIDNVKILGGANSTTTVAIQLGAVTGYEISNFHIDNYQQGFGFTRGNNGNHAHSPDGHITNGKIINCNPNNAFYDLSCPFQFSKSGNYNVTISNVEVYDNRPTAFQIQPVFFDAQDAVTTATASISGGVVTSVTVNTPSNNGYNTVPTITFSGGGGSGATAVAVMDTASNGGTILSITVTAGGSGYTSAPTVTVENTTYNNTFSGIVFENCRLKSYSGRDSVKKAPSAILDSSVVFATIRDKQMGALASYYKEYNDQIIRKYNQILSGTINNINTTFTVPDFFASGSQKVYINGLSQAINDDYIVASSSTIQFVASPQTGDQLTIDYNLN